MIYWYSFIVANFIVTEMFHANLSADTSKDLASELVHYAFINEVRVKAFLFLFLINSNVKSYCAFSIFQQNGNS